jgi:two-component system cell cycle sensor histidine kinase/response regulator CckA
LTKQRKILVVDDEETDREQAATALHAERYAVILADGFSDALAAYDNNPGISFLVADVALPDGNGCALASLIQQRCPTIGVLFVSGHVGAEVCHYYGIDVTDLHFLRKPFEPAELVARVKRVMKSGQPFPKLLVPKTWISSGD